MIKWENMTDIRDSVVLGIGSLNPVTFDAWLDELGSRGVLREAQEKKVFTLTYLTLKCFNFRLNQMWGDESERIFFACKFWECLNSLFSGKQNLILDNHFDFFRGYLELSMFAENGISLNPSIIDFVESMRVNLEADQDRDRDINTVTSMRLHFAKLITLIIGAFSENLITSRSSFRFGSTWGPIASDSWGEKTRLVHSISRMVWSKLFGGKKDSRDRGS